MRTHEGCRLRDRFGFRSSAFAVIAMLFATPAIAQVASKEEKTSAEERQRRDDIIVTAQRSIAGDQVAKDSRVGVLGNANVFDTPFSTKAYTSDLILNQAARSIDDIVQNDPSIRVSLSPTFVLDQVSIRGFQQAAFLFDGLPGFNGYGRSAIQNFDRIEIFKGPTAGLIGAVGSVGGVVNRVPKRATDLPVLSATVGLRDALLATGQLDIGQRFGEGGAFGARLNIYAERGDEFTGSARRLFAPQGAVDFRGRDVRVVLDLNYTRYEMDAPGRNFTLRPGAAVPDVPDPRVNPMPDWWKYDTVQYFGLATVEWDFARHWTVYGRLGYFNEDSAPQAAPLISQLHGNGRFLFSGAGTGSFSDNTTTGEIGVRGTVRLGSMTHQLAASALRSRYNAAFGGYYLEGNTIMVPPITADIYTGSTLPNPYTSGVPDLAEVADPPTTTTSFALADNVALFDDRLKLIVAARRTRIEGGGYDQARISPTFAALFKIGSKLSVYGNYAESLVQGATAPDDAANPREQLPPYVGRQHEVGAKWNGGGYGVTVAYFQITQASAFLDEDNVFRAAGEQRNRGIELETFGEPLRGLRLLGGAAWIDGRQTSTSGGANDGKRALGVPEWTVNACAEVDLAAVPGLTLTARYLHTGSTFVDLANTQRLDAWDKVDAGVRYAAKIADRPVTLRAGVSNLFDHRYWQAAGRNILTVAPPRTWQFSATASF